MRIFPRSTTEGWHRRLKVKRIHCVMLHVILVLCVYAMYDTGSSETMRIGTLSNMSSSAVFVVVCGTGETIAAREVQPLIKSMILLASAPFRMVFVTDRIGSQILERDLSTLRNKQVLLQHVDIRLLNSLNDLRALANRIRYDIQRSHHSGAFGFLKVLLPSLLVDYERFVVLDTDMIFLQDPILLWRGFTEIPAQRRQNTEWLYAMPMSDTSTPATICSCILLLEAKKIRDKKVFPALFNEVLSHGATFHSTTALNILPNGDQGLYFQLLIYHPELFVPLEDKWNCHKCQGYGAAFKYRDEVGLLHRNCFNATENALNPDQATPFFEFFQHYSLQWLPRAWKKGEGTQITTSAMRFNLNSMNER